jgi:hypothetical protein
MTTNVGTLDRVVRAILGLVLIALPFAAGFGTTLMLVSILVGLVMLVVAATRVCPLYSILGIKTCAG